MNRTMRLARWLLAASYQIQSVDPEEDWELGEQVDQIAKRVGIRPDSTKNVGFVAMMGDKVVGGVYIGIKPDPEYNRSDSWIYSFDVVVDPAYQWGRKIGLDLIKAAEKERELYEGEPYEYLRTRLYVINPKLARFLQEYHGYELEAEHEGGSAHLTKY